MKVGKLNWDDLKQIIDNNKSVVRGDVRIRSGIGEDCSVINFGEYECVVSTDPITGADKNMGKLAVHINCNDIASCGVEPVGILVTILVPPTATIEDIKNIMSEIDEETKKLNVEILGGHTEVTEAVNKIIVSCTAIGKGKAQGAVATSGAKIGDEIVVTKLLCMEGTSIIVNDHLDRIQGVLTPKEIEIAKDYISSISVVNEGRIAGEFGVNSMHDITEGGVLGALWEVAEASNLGFKAYSDKMPISDITYKICERLNIDPLKFISSGSMLITVASGKELVDKLNSNGVQATVIGKMTASRGILVKDETCKDVLPPTRDELFSI
ncbi:AIR synthase family protein [Clostridium sp. CF011]|uniref:AIR synthase family protein n=1 Tax=Clostridium sp. CF011 TaxID=2843318 RepID=UPI001C0BCDDE|nr:AIR synthase family protein [Clostridium sp. CF011]MBU3090831.1 AIR synthase family protein [Clostridium sp. CF011]WAG69604.1 AIR synthase family protein [Clostridium sp. CF011]